MKIAKIAAIAGLLAAVALQGFAIEPVSRCQELQEWAAQLKELPADYESFVAYEPDQRRAMYGRLSNAERAVFWQHQLSASLEEKSWNEAQRALIVEVRTFLTEESYAARQADDELARAAAASLEARVAEAFARADSMRVFFDLGPSERRTRLGLVPACDCRLGYPNECGVLGNCNIPVCGTRQACGIGWGDLCDGLCWGASLNF